MKVRINKYIASCGICSRRKAEEFIKEEKVSVNGTIITDLSFQINDELDVVKVDGNVITQEQEKVYIMLNKPRGYITTNSEQFGRKSTANLIDEKLRVYPIGRLDMDTEGLLLFTNDGEFANYMMHPRHNIKKKYIVTTSSKITEEKLEKLRNGVDIGGYVTKEAEVKKIHQNSIEIIISEGKNRQVRKMCDAVNIKVDKLKRIKVGNLELGDLPVGKYIFIKKEDI